MYILLINLSLSYGLTNPDNWRKKFTGGYLEPKYGLIDYESEILDDIFGNVGNQVFMADIGVSAFRLFDIGMGVGHGRSQGYLISTDGYLSNINDELRILPLSGHIKIRGHLWQEQLVIPFGGAGLDYWLWKETWGREQYVDLSSDTDTTSDTESEMNMIEQETIGGGKRGFHYKYGVEILLDKFDRVGESKLYNNFRIEDTYLIVEQRIFIIGQRGLFLDGTSTTFGFRFHY